MAESQPVSLYGTTPHQMMMSARRHRSSADSRPPATQARYRDDDGEPQGPDQLVSASTTWSIPSAGELERTVKSTLGWWTDEYWNCAMCIAAAAALIWLLWNYQGKAEPEWAGTMELETVVIFVMTVYRIALGGIVETCVSQGAWIWVSGFRRGRVEARLEDFKMFDEATRGLWGSILLIWHFRGRHLACAGAFILILMNAFETFSSQMVQFEDAPTPLVNLTDPSAVTAPAPPRAVTWRDTAPRGTGELTIGLSMKAAIYDGILSSSVSEVPVTCHAMNCTWPIIPTLGVCGSCSAIHYREACDPLTCTYTVASGASVTHQDSASSERRFVMAASNASASDSQAIFSAFDVLSLEKTVSRVSVNAQECSLWFCLKSYKISVIGGVQDSAMQGNWSRANFSTGSSAHFDEMMFIDIPPELGADPDTRYSVPTDAIVAMRNFMDGLMHGNASEVNGIVDYSSDLAHAMRNATTDLPGWIARLARSMTNDVRLTGDLGDALDRMSKSTEYSGTGLEMRPRVKVNWWWVIYPIVLMLMGFCYLAQTVWRTARDRVCAWKGDSLPMLFCTVDARIHEQVLDGMDVPGGLNKRIGQTEVELVRTTDGQWFFRTAPSAESPLLEP